MKEKKNLTAIWLCISLVLMLLSGIGASLVQTSGNSVKIKNLKFETTKGYVLAGKLFVPKGTSNEDQIPAIVTCHGMFNDKEMQDAYWVELARRGYVIFTVDMPSHGESEDTDTIDGCLVGTIEGVKYIATLPYVDKEKIGITGHSLGALNANIAVMEDNSSETPLISSVLLNCNDAFYADDDGNFVNVYGNRDVGIIAARYDEFFMSDHDENGKVTPTRDFVQYNNAQSFLHFGQNPVGLDKRESETFYTKTVDGVECDRIIYSVNIIHPWSHFSKRTVTATVDFFERTLGAPNPIASSNQIWQWKEFFNFIGLAGFFIFIVNMAILAARIPGLSVTRNMETPIPSYGKDRALGFWGSLVLSIAFGAISYLPIMYGFHAFMKDNSSWRQSTAFGVGMWAFVTALFAIVLILIAAKSRKNSGDTAFYDNAKMSVKDLGKTFVSAIIVVAAGFFCVKTVNYFFGTDFRIWVIAVKPFASRFLLLSIFPYMFLFTTYYVVNSLSVNVYNNNTIGMKDGKREWVHTLILALTNVMPVVILLAIQYGTYVGTGYMVWTDPGSMYIVWLLSMLVFLPLSAVIAKKVFRETKNPYLPGLINGIIVTLVTCSNTLTWAAK